MSPPAPLFSGPLLSEDHLLRNVHHSRKLLLQSPLHQSSQDTATPPSYRNHWSSSSEPYPGQGSFDANVVMILSVLLCALICALGLNSIIRCALRCPSQVRFEPGNNRSNREANTGVKKKGLKMFPVVPYSTELKLPGLDPECVICLTEFAPGERVRVLPNCHHGFHTRCIDKWLLEHSSCPTCRHSLIDTFQKIVGCTQTSSSTPPPPLPQPQPQVLIVPLEPEGLMHDYQSGT